MVTILTVLAREIEKFYDKKCKYKDTISVLSSSIRSHADIVKERVHVYHSRPIDYKRLLPYLDQLKRRSR